MKPVDLMVFDFDGTLVNSGDDIASSVNYALESLGLPVKERKEILGFIGDGVQKLIQRSLEPGSPDRFAEAMEIFSNHYMQHMLDTTTLCTSVREVLEHFHEKKKIIVTNKRMRFTVAMTDAMDITKYFDEIIGADSTPYRKPDPRLLLPLLEKYGAARERTVVIGDGVNDIILAKETGVLSCALVNGLTDRESLLYLEPDYICETAWELTALFV